MQKKAKKTVKPVKKATKQVVKKTTKPVKKATTVTNPTPTPAPPLPPPQEVTVVVNGVDKGRVRTNNLSIASFAIQQAQAHGVRTFSVYVDGRKVDVDDGNQDLTNASQVEIVAKDSRG